MTTITGARDGSTRERMATIKGRVLLVDDAADVRQFMRVVLETTGWLIDEASDASEALGMFDPTWHDVVVLDQVMPGLSGLDAAAVLRSRGYAGPIVLFSAHLDPSLTAEIEALDVLPVSKVDHTAVLRVLDVYAQGPATP